MNGMEIIILWKYKIFFVMEIAIKRPILVSFSGDIFDYYFTVANFPACGVYLS